MCKFHEVFLALNLLGKAFSSLPISLYAPEPQHNCLPSPPSQDQAMAPLS